MSYTLRVDLGLKRTRNAVYQTAYQAVWIPKYPKKVLVGGVAERLRGVLHTVCQAKGLEMLALEIQADHVHLFFSAPPPIAPSLAIQWVKGMSARTLFAECPGLRTRLRRGHLWAPSFSLGTAGQVSAETITRDIDRTEPVRARR